MYVIMCGIFSTIQYRSRSSPVDIGEERRIEESDVEKIEDKIEEGFKSLVHRGPDFSSITRISKLDEKGDYYLNLGFHRLSIIDPDEESSNQPFYRTGVYLLCNGEIYGYKKLREKFGLICSSDSDCEVILALYFHFDKNIEKVIEVLFPAEFAFVLYDSIEEKIYISRDLFGVRPLFISYSSLENGEKLFSIASELKGIVQGNGNNVNIITPRQFTPGFIGEISLDKINGISYREFSYARLGMEKIRSDTEEDVRDNIKYLLTKSIQEYSYSDRPIGALLSGGLDSSLIVSILGKIFGKITCFSIGLENSIDVQSAKEVVQYMRKSGIEVNHHIVNFTVEEGLNAIEDVIKSIETYDITTIRASVPQYLLAKYISEKTDIKVIFSGEGSDEIFQSYMYFRNSPSPMETHKDGIRLLEELHFFDCLRTDRTMSRWGLEVRAPFLNREFVEYVLSTNPEYRYSRDKIEKKILREAFSDGYLPENILWRKKEAFSDAVSSKEISWYESIQQFIIKKEGKEEEREGKDEEVFVHNPPQTLEAKYYRKLFNKYYKYDNIIPHYWLPKWSGNIMDPSATKLECYTGELRQ